MYANGGQHFPMGDCPIIDPETGETIIDSEGRRSHTSSFEFGPTVGKNIALAFLPHEYCQEGRMLETSYMEENYPMKVTAVGYGALYDPENVKPRL